MEIDLGAGDDDLKAWSYWFKLPVTIRDGPGDDAVDFGAPGATVIDGPGNDLLVLRGAGARIVAEPGGHDIFAGAQGVTLDYGDYTDPLGMSFDDVANDGAAGDHDNILTRAGNMGFTTVVGGAGPDRIASTGMFRAVDGGPGDDVLTGDIFATLFGGPGDDTLSGAPGQHGGAGEDRLTAAAVASELDGGHGDDVLTGGTAGRCLHDGPGADSLGGGGDRHGVLRRPHDAGTLSLNGVADGGRRERDYLGADIEVLSAVWRRHARRRTGCAVARRRAGLRHGGLLGRDVRRPGHDRQRGGTRRRRPVAPGTATTASRARATTCAASSGPRQPPSTTSSRRPGDRRSTAATATTSSTGGGGADSLIGGAGLGDRADYSDRRAGERQPRRGARRRGGGRGR